MTREKKTLVPGIGSKIRSEIEAINQSPDTEFFKEQAVKEKGFVDQQLEWLLKIELVEEKRHLNSNLQQDRDLRRSYANKLFVLTCIWISIIFLMLFLEGFKCYFLSDKVLITLITSTTATFLGLFTLVIRYLFYKPADKVEKKGMFSKADK